MPGEHWIGHVTDTESPELKGPDLVTYLPEALGAPQGEGLNALVVIDRGDLDSPSNHLCGSGGILPSF